MIRQRPIGHMPFAGHRTQAEVREEEERRTLLQKLRSELRQGQMEERREMRRLG